MLNITNIREMQIKNHNEISPHDCQNGSHQKVYKEYIVVKDIEKRECLCTVGGNVNSCSH